MKHIKSFDRFKKFLERAGAPAPAQPTIKPGTKPAEPGTKPGKRDRPTPIRKDEPNIKPDPKARKASMVKSTAEQVANTFIKELNKKGESVKKYIKK